MNDLLIVVGAIAVGIVTAILGGKFLELFGLRPSNRRDDTKKKVEDIREKIKKMPADKLSDFANDWLSRYRDR